MATAYRVLKNTAKAGNAIIGAGVYSAVLQHGKPWECKVIKIGNSSADPWLDYAEFAKKLGENCHTPHIDKLYVDHYSEYYVANMEELRSEPYDDEYIDRHELAQSISDLIVGRTTKQEFAETWLEFKSVLFPWGYTTFFEVVDMIIDNTDCFTNDDIEMVEAGLEFQTRKLDLHGANIMFRNNTVVITDPWCNCAVDDHPSMESYIEESEDKNVSNYYNI